MIPPEISKMKENLRILLTGDIFPDVVSIKHLLKKEELPFFYLTVEKKNYKERLLDFKPDVVIFDQSLPKFNSLEALKIYQQYKRDYNPSSAFIIVTEIVSEEFAIEAVSKGADDYVFKNSLKRLPTAISNAIEKNQLKEDKKKTQDEKLQLLRIFQKSKNELFTFDPTTLLIDYVNQEALNNLGYTRNEVLKMTPLDFLVKSDESLFKNFLESSKKSKKGKIFEIHFVRKNGSHYPIQIHLEMIKLESKNSFLANVLDLTDATENKQQKDLALFIQNCFAKNRNLETSLQIILKEICTSSTVCSGEIWAMDFEGEALKRHAFWDINNEDPGKTGLFLAQQAIETGKPNYIDLRKDDLSIKDQKLNQARFMAMGALPLKSGSQITAVIVMYDSKFVKKRNPFINLNEVVQDKLTGNIRRKKTEQELQMIFELSPDILTIIGKDGFIRKINPAIQKILGYSSEEILSIPFDNLVHPEDAHVLEEWRDLHLNENEVVYYESRFLAKNGNYRCFSWSITPFLKQEIHFAVGRDITEYKEQVCAIQSQNKRLTEIAWEQCHIVRAPLTRLMACISYLQDDKNNSDKILKSIETSAYEIDEILKNIVSKTQLVKQYEEY